MPSKRSRSAWPAIALATAAGLGIRLYFGVGVRQPSPPKGCSVDPRWFREQAVWLTKGKWFVNPCLAHVGRFVLGADHPPLFSALLALADLMGLRSMDAQRAAIAVVGSSAVVLCGLLGGDLAGRRGAMAAAWAAAVLPGMWAFNAQVISENLTIPLVAATVLLAYRMHARPRLPTAAGLGALCALAALTRSELAVLSIAFAPIFVRSLPWKRRVSYSFAYAAVGLLIAGPWMGLNLAQFSRTEVLSTQLGATLAGDDCPAAFSGPEIGTWVESCVTADVRRLDVTGASRQDYALRHVASGYLDHHLGRLPAVVLAREARGFEVWPHQLNSVVWDFLAAGGWVVWAGWLYHDVFMVTLPIWLAGLWWLRRHRKRIWILLTPICLYALIVGAFSADSRYSSDCQPVLAVVTGVALAAFWAWTFELPLDGTSRPRPSKAGDVTVFPSRVLKLAAPGFSGLPTTSSPAPLPPHVVQAGPLSPPGPAVPAEVYVAGPPRRPRGHPLAFSSRRARHARRRRP